MRKPIASDTQEYVWFSNLQFSKKKPIQTVVIVLAGVNQDMVSMLVEELYDQAQTNDFRPCAEDCHDLHRSNSTDSMATSSSMRPCSFSSLVVSSRVITVSAELYALLRTPEPRRLPQTSGNIGNMANHRLQATVLIASSSQIRISCIFSPGRIPIILRSIFLSPMRAAAISVTNAEGTLGTKVSPGNPHFVAAKIVSTASSRLKKKRVISGVVMVTGPPLRIWSWNNGMTEPREANTFPYRTQRKRVPGHRKFA